MLGQKGGVLMLIPGFNNINTTTALPWMRNLVFGLMSTGGIEEVLIAPISLNTKPYRSEANTLCFYRAQVVAIDQKQIGQMILRLNGDDGTQGQDILLIFNPSLAKEESRLQAAIIKVKASCQNNFPFRITASLSYQETGVAEIHHPESTIDPPQRKKRKPKVINVGQGEEEESNWLRILSASWPFPPSELVANKGKSKKGGFG